MVKTPKGSKLHTKWKTIRLTSYVCKKPISTRVQWKKSAGTPSFILAAFLTKTERQDNRTRTLEEEREKEKAKEKVKGKEQTLTDP